MKLKLPEELVCLQCGEPNPSAKNWEKRPEALRKCLVCGAKRQAVVV